MLNQGGQYKPINEKLLIELWYSEKPHYAQSQIARIFHTTPGSILRNVVRLGLTRRNAPGSDVPCRYTAQTVPYGEPTLPPLPSLQEPIWVMRGS